MVFAPQVVRLAEDQIEKIVQHVLGKVQDSMKEMIKSVITGVLDEHGCSFEPSDSQRLPSISNPTSSIEWTLRISHHLHVDIFFLFACLILLYVSFCKKQASYHYVNILFINDIFYFCEMNVHYFDPMFECLIKWLMSNWLIYLWFEALFSCTFCWNTFWLWPKEKKERKDKEIAEKERTNE